MLALLALFTTLVFAQGPPNPQFGTISGTLLSRDGTPAANMRVSTVAVDDSSGIAALLSITQTDAAGRYRLDNVRPGRFLVVAGRVDAPTYFPGMAVRTGATVVTIAPGQEVTGIDFRMLASSGLRFAGRVVRQDSQGAGVPAAPAGASGPPFQMIAGAAGTTIVRLSGGTVGPIAPSGEGAVAPDGSFQFTNLAPGTYQVMITPAGPTVPRLSVTLVDKDITDFQFVVPFMVAVPGTVTVEGGGPTPRFQLTFSDAAPRPAAQGPVPTPAGPAGIAVGPTFTAQLRSGDQMVNVSGLLAGYTLKSITSGGTDLVRNPLKVAPGVAPIQIVLGTSSPSPFVRLTGRVVGRAEWHLLTNFNVTLPQMAGSPEVVFYLDGTFEFPMTLPGDHQIRLSDASVAMLTSVVSAGQSNAVIHVPNTPVTSAALPPLIGTLAVKVSGRIVGRARASRGAKVRMINPNGGETLTSPAFMDGSFEFPRMTPGTYTAEIYPPVPGASPTTITVGDSDMKDVRITVPDTRHVRGRIQMEGNTPMPRALTFAFASGNPVTVNPRGDGSFQVELPISQRINLVTGSIPRNHSLASMTYGTVDLRNNTFPASESASDELRVVFRSTSPAVRVSGRVAGAAPLADGAVAWLIDASGAYQTIETAISGNRTFVFPAVPPGNYTARLSAPGASAATASVPVLAAGSAITGIEIAPELSSVVASFTHICK